MAQYTYEYGKIENQLIINVRSARKDGMADRRYRRVTVTHTRVAPHKHTRLVEDAGWNPAQVAAYERAFETATCSA